MVFRVNKKSLSILPALLVLLLSPPHLSAADNMWDSVFRYQQKMAGFGQPEAQVKLGQMYEEGHGTEQSFDTAEQWYRKALSQGFGPAQEKLEQLQQRRQQAAQAVKEQEQAAQQRLASEKAERERIERERMALQRAETERLASEIEQKQEQERSRQQAEDKARTAADEAKAAEDERIARKRAQEAMKKMLATPGGFDED